MSELTNEMLQSDSDCWYQPSTEAERLACEDWRNLHRDIAWREKWAKHQREQMLALAYRAGGVVAIVIGLVGLWWLAGFKV